VITVVGGGFFLISLFLGGIGDWLGDVFDGLDTALEGIGIDVIPDDVDTDAKGAGCTTFLAFLTGFGAAGLIVSLSGVGATLSILAGIGFGLVVGAIYFWTIQLIMRHQANSMATDSDIVGKTGRVSVSIPENGIGQVTLTVRDDIRPFPAWCENSLTIEKGQAVKVVSVEGGRLFVERVA